MAVATLFNSSRFIAHLLIVTAPISRKRRGRHDAGVDSRCAVPASQPQDLDARQRLAFHPFEKRAARGRHVGEPSAAPARLSAATVSPPPATETSLPACGQLAPPPPRPRWCRCRRARARMRRTGRSTPPSSPAPARRSTCSTRARADVEDHVVGRRPRRSPRCATALRLELLGDDGVDRQHDSQSLGLRACQDLARRVGEVVLAQRFADRACPAPRGTCSPCRRR